MQKTDFTLYFIVPVSHKIIPLSILYGQEIIFDHLVMPWETGISKQICFCIAFDAKKFQPRKLKIINSLNKMPVTLEIIKLNNEIKNMSEQFENNKKQIYLDTFLKACDLEASVLKIMGLPNTVSVSHSYLCNGNLYVPKCDRHNSVISFNNAETQELKFVVEFFETNLTECLCHIECSFDKGMIEASIKQSYHHNISQLHANLKNHYEEICDEEFAQNSYGIHHTHKLLTFPTVEQTITQKEAFSQDITPYSVIKIEGLASNIDISKHEIFYQNNAYYVSNNNKKSYHYLLSQASKDDAFIVSYYHHNTFEPVLKNTVLYAIQIHDIQKTA